MTLVTETAIDRLKATAEQYTCLPGHARVMVSLADIRELLEELAHVDRGAERVAKLRGNAGRAAKLMNRAIATLAEDVDR